MTTNTSTSTNTMSTATEAARAKNKDNFAIAIYPSHTGAESAIKELQKAGLGACVGWTELHRAGRGRLWLCRFKGNDQAIETK